MIAEQPTRRVVKQLKEAGFRPVARRGSHTKWKKGERIIVVPDGHATISPGVYRQIQRAIEEAQ